jgi:hypothetical protein
MSNNTELRRRAVRPCECLTGDNVAPRTIADARKLIGHRIEYLRREDIDRSGRGYFFPRYAIVKAAVGREIETRGGDFIPLTRLVEVVDQGPAPPEE